MIVHLVRDLGGVRADYCADVMSDADLLLGYEGDRPDGRRVEVDYDAETLYDWAMVACTELEQAIRDQVDAGATVAAVHANDWSTVPAGITAAAALDVPLVVTLHSTEQNRGYDKPHSPLISKLEWQACYDAETVVIRTDEAEDSVLYDLDVPADKTIFDHDGREAAACLDRLRGDT